VDNTGKHTTLSNYTILHTFTSSIVTYMHYGGSTVPCPPGYMQRKAFPSSSAWIFPAGVSSPPHLSISTSDGSVSFDILATESTLATVTSCPLAFLSAGSAHGTSLPIIKFNYKKTNSNAVLDLLHNTSCTFSLLLSAKYQSSFLGFHTTVVLSADAKG